MASHLLYAARFHQGKAASHSALDTIETQSNCGQHKTGEINWQISCIFDIFTLPHMTGGQLHAYCHIGARQIAAYDNALPPLAAILMWSRLWQVPGIATLPTLSAVALPLPRKAAAIEFVIIVIGRRLKSIAPS